MVPSLRSANHGTLRSAGQGTQRRRGCEDASHGTPQTTAPGIARRAGEAERTRRKGNRGEGRRSGPPLRVVDEPPMRLERAKHPPARRRTASNPLHTSYAHAPSQSGRWPPDQGPQNVSEPQGNEARGGHVCRESRAADSAAATRLIPAFPRTKEQNHISRPGCPPIPTGSTSRASLDRRLTGGA